MKPARIVTVLSGLLAIGAVGVAARAEAAPIESQCSIDSATRVAIAVMNTSPDDTFDIFWVNYRCEEIYKGTIAPGERWDQRTFLSHPWRIREADSGRMVKQFVTNANTSVITFVK